MTFALEPMNIESLKAEARALREEKAKTGTPVTLASALESTAKAHGFRDWNTASGTLKEHVACPYKLGQHLTGKYLKQEFSGTVLSLTSLPGGKFYRMIIKFAKPVDVVTFDSFSAFRQRVTATVDAYGRSPAHTSDGAPHMQIDMPHLKRRK